ncbi:putative DNA topoisomerase IA [Chlorella virus XW01]|nr:putative DNA topoisomerase IA [Chlorella virus XW01]
MILVIVESPGKIKKIESYLGDNYIVKASYGHFLDLDPENMSIEIENNFKPNYIISKGKNNVVNDLRKIASECDDVIIASDEDREGEKIAADLATILKLNNPKRIVFHEITKKAINEAVNNPRTINYYMVEAQQARRILDRLMGYLLSPLLWKSVPGGKSAGRVQSVVVKILADKEVDIENSISNPFFKTQFELKINKIKAKSLLVKNNSMQSTILHKFDSYDDALNFANKIKEDNKYEIVKIEDKESIRNPSPPFTTSSLQQDASSKLHFNVKKTMDVAQKLYEAGYITYMRTDSISLSKEAIDKTKEYVITNFGDIYSNPNSYNSNNKSKKDVKAQEAHEAIRPTDINKVEIKSDNKDEKRLYNLIWKRTIASQMSSAIFDVQNIHINIKHSSISTQSTILPKNSILLTILENIKFDGFLKLYNNQEKAEGNDSEDANDIDDESKLSELNIKVKMNDKVKFNNLKISEEYTKPPLRYNEAGLVKYLEKNGIGRPSTYSSIISKVIERDYVRIQNIEGVIKDSRNIMINKNKGLTEDKKDIIIGKETNKLVPTEMGKKVNKFLIDNFDNIMDIKFTAKFEKYLDKIANGDAKWYNIIKKYYEEFAPKIDELKVKSIELKKQGINSEDRLIGLHPESKLPIYVGLGKYGNYLKILEKIGSTKWLYTSLKDLSDEEIQNLDLNKVLEIMSFPKLIGKINKSDVYLCKGQYGLYLKVGTKNYSLKENSNIDINNIDIEFVKNYIVNYKDNQKAILDNKKEIDKNINSKYCLKEFTTNGKTIYVKNGQYGHYLQIDGKKKINVKIPEDVNIDSLDLETVLGIIAMVRGTKKVKK